MILGRLLLCIFFVANNFSGNSSNEIDYEFINNLLSHEKSLNVQYISYETYYPNISKSNEKKYIKELKGGISKPKIKSILKKAYEYRSSEKYIFNKDSFSQPLIDIDTIKNKNIIFHYFSIPIFDNDKEYAIIEVASGTSRNNLIIYKALYKKSQGGEWVLIKKFGYSNT